MSTLASGLHAQDAQGRRRRRDRAGRLRTPAGCGHIRRMAQRDLPVRAHRFRPANLHRISRFRAEYSQRNFLAVPKALTIGGSSAWPRLQSRHSPRASAYRPVLSRVSVPHRQFPGSPVQAPGTPRESGRWYVTISCSARKPDLTEPYNALQKLAYTSAVLLGVLSTLTGLVLFKPVQFRWLAFVFGGFHLHPDLAFPGHVRISVVYPGHLVMVLLHGWNNFFSMLSGWKKEPRIPEGIASFM